MKQSWHLCQADDKVKDGKQSECEDCRLYQIKKRRRVPGAEAGK